jgi:hypothetical protein
MRNLMLGTALALLAGCATAADAGDNGAVTPGASGASGLIGADLTGMSPEDALTHFMLRVPNGEEVSVLVADRAITGPRIQLSRYVDASDHAIRGEAFRKPVNIEVTAAGVSGVYGGGQFDIKIALAGEDITVQGTVGGQPTAFKLGPAGLLGHVGRCMYQMQRQGAEFAGTRGCGRGMSYASLSFPSSFGKWSMAEMAAALSILLSGGV